MGLSLLFLFLCGRYSLVFRRVFPASLGFYCLPSHGVVVQFFLLAVMVSGSRSIVLSWCRGSGVFSGMGWVSHLTSAVVVDWGSGQACQVVLAPRLWSPKDHRRKLVWEFFFFFTWLFQESFRGSRSELWARSCMVPGSSNLDGDCWPSQSRARNQPSDPQSARSPSDGWLRLMRASWRGWLACGGFFAWLSFQESSLRSVMLLSPSGFHDMLMLVGVGWGEGWPRTTESSSRWETKLPPGFPCPLQSRRALTVQTTAWLTSMGMECQRTEAPGVGNGGGEGSGESVHVFFYLVVLQGIITALVCFKFKPFFV